MAETKVTFRCTAPTPQSVKVFYGATDGFCVDKPNRHQFTIETGSTHTVDVGPDRICYCYQDVQLGVPQENCGHQTAMPGDVVELI